MQTCITQTDVIKQEIPQRFGLLEVMMCDIDKPAGISDAL
jgi:hypothetical protein